MEKTVMSYDSTPKLKFVQDEPESGKQDARGWKTVNGYIRESKQLSRCILLNNRPLIHHVVINIDADLTESEHKQLWATISKQLRKQKVEAIYIRESNSTGNRLHYHLLTTSSHTELTLELPNVRVRLESIESQVKIAYYFTKSGRKHSSKRRLFSKEFKLNKWGTIGRFWHKPKQAIWQDVIAHERKLATYRTTELVNEARKLQRLTGIPFKKIIRNLCDYRMRQQEG